jgi:hypothetical protein
MTGFIVHASRGNMTEIDAMAVRFPYYREPETEIEPDRVLSTSDSLMDFLVCEVKSGTRINFNASFRDKSEAITSVLNRFGAFPRAELSNLIARIEDVLHPENIRRSQVYPTIPIPSLNSRIRLLLVAPNQKRSDARKPKPYIYGDDMILYIWDRFRPEVRRQRCDVRYDLNLWGEYTELVAYFKDKKRVQPGDIDSIYGHFGLSVPSAGRHPEFVSPHA